MGDLPGERVAAFLEVGLNVMESANGANPVIAYGKGGEIASNRCDEQEMLPCARAIPNAISAYTLSGR
ncbi:transposase [Streptomyces sp. R-74717]|uniref:hypothetical protein n=1 Tax=Streptomyces TaxID=1883 RepID=UPI0037A1F59E